MANLPAKLQVRSAPRRWHNHLPEWMLQEACYWGFRGSVRHTLQCVADACPPGEILRGAVAGQELFDSIGCSRATFFRHIEQLEIAGFVVRLGPGRPGAARKVGQEYMLPPDPGRYRPQTIVAAYHPGARPQARETRQPTSQNGNPQVPKRDDDSAKMRQSTCQNETAPYVGSYGIYENHENHGAAQSRGRKMRHLEASELEDLDRLWLRFGEAVGKGLVGNSDDGLLCFVSAAEHACRLVRRDGGNAAALFAATVNQQRWLYITNADEDAAHRRIKAWRRVDEVVRE